MPIDVKHYSDSLRQDDTGAWISDASSDVSYPSSGHQSCFELEPQSFWFNHRNRCIVDLVTNHPPDGPIFDIGGGNGFVTAALAGAGFPTALVEPGSVGVANARARGVTTTIHTEAQAAGFRPASLPAIGMFDVLEHVEDDIGMLRWINTSLTPEGRLYLTVPAFDWLWSNEDDHAGHYRRYTKALLSERLAGTGFATEFVSYFFAPLVAPILLVRTLPTRLGMRTDTTGDHAATEHTPPAAGLIGSLLDREARRLAGGNSLPFGSSLLVAARKR